MVNDIGKMVLLGISLLLGGALAILGTIVDKESATLAGVGLIGTVVGYMTGNGVLAKTGNAPSPVYVPKAGKIEERADELADDAAAVTL